MVVTWTPERAREVIKRGAMRGVIAGTELVHDEGTRRIESPPKSGLIYRRRGVAHRASAPGEAPASDTGRLAASGGTSYDHENLVGRATWSTKYAEALELGTQTIEPRPFARVSLLAKEAEIRAGIAAGISAEIAAAGGIP